MSNVQCLTLAQAKKKIANLKAEMKRQENLYEELLSLSRKEIGVNRDAYKYYRDERDHYYGLLGFYEQQLVRLRKDHQVSIQLVKWHEPIPHVERPVP